MTIRLRTHLTLKARSARLNGHTPIRERRQLSPYHGSSRVESFGPQLPALTIHSVIGSSSYDWKSEGPMVSPKHVGLCRVLPTLPFGWSVLVPQALAWSRWI